MRALDGDRELPGLERETGVGAPRWQELEVFVCGSMGKRGRPSLAGECQVQNFSGIGVFPSRAGSSLFLPHQGTVSTV